MERDYANCGVIIKGKARQQLTLISEVYRNQHARISQTAQRAEAACGRKTSKCPYSTEAMAAGASPEPAPPDRCPCVNHLSVAFLGITMSGLCMSPKHVNILQHLNCLEWY